MADKVEMYTDNAGEYRWRRKAGNGEIIGASTEGYKSEADCKANCDRMEAGNDSDKWEFYTDKGGEHRWRCSASNGQIVGASSESYKNEADCIANAQRNGHKG